MNPIKKMKNKFWEENWMYAVDFEFIDTSKGANSPEEIPNNQD